MENKTGDGFLKDPLKEIGVHINEISKYYKSLEFNINELKKIIDTFQNQAREGCMLVQDGMIVWANKAVSDISGYSPDELAGKALSDAAVPNMRDKLAARISMLIAGDTISMPEEWPLLKGDRTIAYINVFAYRVNFMNNLALLVFFYDMTEEKKIVEERRMRAEMMDSINDGVFLMEMTGRIVYANESFGTAVGYTRDEVTKMHILDMTAPEVRKRYDIRMKQFSLHKEARFTTVALSKDGTRINVEVRGKVIMNGGKQRLLGVSRVIRTELEPDIDSIQLP
jgi:PAS domain S-box-containing protein